MWRMGALARRRAAAHALVIVSVVCSAFSAISAQSAPPGSVVLVMLDGLRWQEVFTGADSLLMFGTGGGIDDTARARREFWAPSVEERRRRLVPFLWDTIAARGQLLGDAAHGSVMRVTNGFDFSYPGYNETLTGKPDPRINTNAFPPNPNVTVFEWINGRPGFKGRVAAFGTWDAFPRIFNRDRAKFDLWAGWEDPATALPAAASPAAPSTALTGALLATTTRIWDDVSYDSFMQVLVRDYIAARKPRLLFVGFGETDVWAHDGKYERMLRSARQGDAFIAELWSIMQGMPEYRGKVTFIITTDHGRGDGPKAWRDHGNDVPGADRTWVAIIGPGVAPLGARTSTGLVTQSQLAATIARALGEDWRSFSPEAGAALDLSR